MYRISQDGSASKDCSCCGKPTGVAYLGTAYVPVGMIAMEVERKLYHRVVDRKRVVFPKIVTMHDACQDCAWTFRRNPAQKVSKDHPVIQRLREVYNPKKERTKYGQE